MNKPRLLYLGFAFPPGVSALYPELQPAGHVIETSMLEAVRPWFELRSTGISQLEVGKLPVNPDASLGLPHELNLVDKAPELVHRYHSLRRLKAAYLAWLNQGWRPEVLMVCNFSPVYDAFILWLKRQPGPAPRLVLYLADSTTLGEHVPWTKRFRYRFKPLVYPDTEILPLFDACVATSRTTEKHFAPRGKPWLWLPNGSDARRALSPEAGPEDGAVQFGYFGALAEHTGLPALLRIFTGRKREGVLHICGYGKSKDEIAAQCAADVRLRFYPPRSPDECLKFALNCDVLVNARPLCKGNDNNFSSKVFEYALSGRSILTSKVSGVDAILGEQAYYFDENNFEPTLEQMLLELAQISRSELKARGAALQSRVFEQFSWAKQGQKLANFLISLMRPA